MGQFIEMKDHSYRDLTLEFLSILHVDVIRGSQCEDGYISFHMQGQFYELNLSIFNEISSFPPSLDLSLQLVPHEFNLNMFWDEILGDFRYTTSSCKGTFIENPCI